MTKFLILMIILSLVSSGCEKVKDFLPFRARKPKEEAKLEVEYKEPAGKVLARVKDRIITLEEFNTKIEVLPSEFKDFYLKDVEGKKRFLDEMINRELMIQEALDRRLDNDVELRGLIKELRDQLLYAKLIDIESKKVNVTDNEVRDYYKNFKEQFKEPEERKISVIVLPTEKEARVVLLDVLKGADFTTLAKQKSVHSTAKDGGDFGFIVKSTPFPQPGKRTVFPQLEQQAFSLDPKATSTYFKGPDGYYIVKFEEVKKAKQQSLTDVYEEIKQGVLIMKQTKAFQDLIGELKKETRVERYDELLK